LDKGEVVNQKQELNMSIKNRRDSELIMELGTAMERAEEYHKAIPILKEARLNRASATMSSILAANGRIIRRVNKELARRKEVIG
jgi:prefoldin subunit 5